MFNVIVYTQDHENYGAHSWNGQGACPQYWKAKSGDSICVAKLPTEDIVDLSHNNSLESFVTDRINGMNIEVCNEAFLTQVLDSELLDDSSFEILWDSDYPNIVDRTMATFEMMDRPDLDYAGTYLEDDRRGTIFIKRPTTSH